MDRKLSLAKLKNKHVLIIAPQPFYTDRGTPIAVKYVLEALSQLGATVDLLTLPMGDDIEIQGVEVHRVMNPLRLNTIPVGFSLAKLLFDVFLFGKAFFMLRRRSYDFIHGIEEAVFIAIVARGYLRIPIIYDMASSLPEHLGEKLLFRQKTVRTFIMWAERWALSKVAMVICSAGLGDRVREIVPNSKILNWHFPTELNTATAENLTDLRTELHIPDDALIVFYSGNFAEYQGVGLLFEAMPRVMDAIPNLYIVCIGANSASEIEAVYEVIDDVLRDRTRLIQRQPKNRVIDFYSLADVLVSPRSSLDNFPLKIFDYLGSGKPIVATDVPAHRCILNDSLALLVKPTSDDIAEGIIKILKDSNIRASLVRNALRFTQRELSWCSFVSLVQQIYEGAILQDET